MPFSLIFLIAAVQGLTEFLPVSSSGHLLLIPVFTNQPYQGLTIDVAAHVGTLIAVLAYLHRDVIGIINSLLNRNQTPEVLGNRQIGLMIVVATLPVALIGLVVSYENWQWIRLLTTLAWANLIFATLLWTADRFGGSSFNLTSMRWPLALCIGLMQVCALIPGVSRSGVTMTAARAFGYGRLAAARFSLMLSLPAIAGAALLKIIDLVKLDDAHLGLDAALVALLSAIFALLAIHLMMSWLAKANFTIFVFYRLAFGSILLLALQQGWIANAI
jgi:undecaprenyl-diphosphatase